ncbi:MAG: preprotein translocase subunit YajC [Planctomycetota bacterium]
MTSLWFLLIAPERKRQKERQAMLAALKKNDKVVTAGSV